MFLGYLVHQCATIKHKFWVMFYILKYCIVMDLNFKLIRRGLKHDLSKFSWPEAKSFAKVIFKLKAQKYGSEEYRNSLEAIRPALQRHYRLNRHHPQYHKNGFADMSELDKLEMICDWTAATRRHGDGNIMESIKVNQERFGFDDSERFRFMIIAMNLKGFDFNKKGRD